MSLEGRRLYLRPLEASDAAALLQLNVENRSFFAPRESLRSDDYYTLETQLARIEGGQTMLAEEKGALFGVFLREDDELVGFLGLYA